MRAIAMAGAVVIAAMAAPSGAATLPAHAPLRILVIGDDVNPWGLSDGDLTQSADIVAALNAGDSGLTLAAPVTLVASQCVDDALTALAGSTPPDVVVYFAHQSARGCNASDQQPALTAAFTSFVTAGGGIVVLHHGMYTAAGKGPVLQLLGATAGSIDWQVTAGQRVWNVAPGHFVTSNGLAYTASAALVGGGDVPSGTFTYFDNIPDERYPQTQLLTEAGESRTVLFASDSGGARVLGYALERSGWSGRVVWYQPAEYQPHALDDRAGPNFQILANAIVYAAHREGTPPLVDGVGPGIDAPGGDPPADDAGGCCDSGATPASPIVLTLALAALWLRRPRRG